MVMTSAMLRASVSGSLSLSSKTQARPAPTLALVDLDPVTAQIMRKVFTDCGVRAIDVQGDFAVEVTKQKLEGCALRLDSSAAAKLKAIRSSPSNRRMMIYGIASPETDVSLFSEYGVNAIFDHPLDRSVAFRAARSTCALLFQELRRYVRIPLVIAVTVEWTDKRIVGSSREVSGGGMSVHLPETPPAGTRVRLTFTLPQRPTIRISSAICWRQDSHFGFQFDDSDPGRKEVKRWIDEFLGLP
jgi:hypothetical protein